MAGYTIYRGESLEWLLRERGPVTERLISPLLDEFLRQERGELAFFLEGLPGCGKTSIMFHALASLPLDKCLYVSVERPEETDVLQKELFQYLYDRSVRYVFLDDTDRLLNFDRHSKFLGDFLATDKRMVVAGHAAVLYIAAADPFLGCAIPNDINRMTFAEWSAINQNDDFTAYVTQGSPGLAWKRMENFLDVVCGLCVKNGVTLEGWKRDKERIKTGAKVLLEALVMQGVWEMTLEMPEEDSPGLRSWVEGALDQLQDEMVRLQISESLAASFFKCLDNLNVLDSARSIIDGRRTPGKLAPDVRVTPSVQFMVSINDVTPYGVYRKRMNSARVFREPGIFFNLAKGLLPKLPVKTRRKLLDRVVRQQCCLDIMAHLPLRRSWFGARCDADGVASDEGLVDLAVFDYTSADCPAAIWINPAGGKSGGFKQLVKSIGDPQKRYVLHNGEDYEKDGFIYRNLTGFLKNLPEFVASLPKPDGKDGK